MVDKGNTLPLFFNRLLLGCTGNDMLENEVVYFEDGTISVGSEQGEMNKYPVHQVSVDPFYISENLVTMAEFRKYVEATGFVSEAEKFDNSGVFDVETGTWTLVEGANWKKPFGPVREIAKDDHPVTQVSWNDSVAYGEWAGVRLPTEIEWEFAAKGGKDSDNRFSWGNELVSQGGFGPNVWQGQFPDSVSVEDGYLYTSPVGAFGKTEAGLTDMGGNVWEWTSDTYRLFEGNRYRFPARSFNTRESATFHMGFRIARDAE